MTVHRTLYIIHPETGYYNSITNNLITRAILSQNEFQGIIDASNNFKRYNNIMEWDTSALVNFRIEVEGDIAYRGTCDNEIPNDISEFLIKMGT